MGASVLPAAVSRLQPNETATTPASVRWGGCRGFLSGSAEWEISLKDLLDAELIAAGDGASKQVVVEEPAPRLPGDKVQTLARALHELAANTVRYGAIG
jgi:hypothetical protein